MAWPSPAWSLANSPNKRTVLRVQSLFGRGASSPVHGQKNNGVQDGPGQRLLVVVTPMRYRWKNATSRLRSVMECTMSGRGASRIPDSPPERVTTVSVRSRTPCLKFMPSTLFSHVNNVVCHVAIGQEAALRDFRQSAPWKSRN